MDKDELKKVQLKHTLIRKLLKLSRKVLKLKLHGEF